MQNNRAVGTTREEMAADCLAGKGYVLLEKNYRTKVGEIDLIALDSGTLVFVEVKYRRGNRSGYPVEAVNAAKQQKIYRTAQMYLIRHPEFQNYPCRFDVVSCEPGKIQILQNAFGGI